MTTSGEPFVDRLARAMAATRSIACVGLDPVLEKLPAAAREGRSDVDAIGHFCEGVLQAVAGVVPVVKFQSACFERYSAAGVGKLHALIAQARELGLLTILDAKRGDIGVTAEHYAHAALVAAGADSLTVSPYLGFDTLEPYLAAAGGGKGLFVLVRTSNPGSDGLQSLTLADGRTVAVAVAEMAAEFGRKSMGANGLSSIGAVVGATKAGDAAALRRAMPDQVFLIPGFGAQGGKAEDIVPMLRARPLTGHASSLIEHGVLVTASRSVIYPTSIGDAAASWAEEVSKSAQNLNRELAQILNSGL
ncbi:MAG: orotidine-5'-phosphate decarboxylase [Phycisphaerales bacterium]|nr:orotidine-5'-phosphate decarboxylase [Phycisphaerales bacterium]